MIKHLFKIIWTERKTNVWILVELIIAFAILWFCSDILLYSAEKLLEPKGFNAEHTYIIDIWNEDEGIFDAVDPEAMGEEEFAAWLEDANKTIANWGDELWEIYDRIERHPAVEHVSLSLYSTPYAGSYWGNSYLYDTIRLNMQVKMVTPSFFDVFQIDILKGRNFNDADESAEKNVIISGKKNNISEGVNLLEVNTLFSNKKENTYDVIGVAAPTKRIELEDYSPILYNYLSKNDEMLPGASYYVREFSVRVKPEADKNFVENFVNDMSDQLEIGSFFLASVIPLKERRAVYMFEDEYTNGFRNIYSISAFLIVNIILCIAGTFWLRIQSRRADIGLRMALGASKKSVQSFFVVETLLLLFIASIIAFIICININEVLADILYDMGFFVSGRSSFGVYLTNYAATFITIAIIAILSVWYPAKRAAGINPVEALRINN